MKKPKGEYAIQTVVNALRLLEAFRDETELGVTELSRRLGLHKNNVFRLLATLEQRGYIQQSCDSEAYRLGVRCLELGQAYSSSQSLQERARPLLRELARDCGETVHLGVMNAFEVVHIDGAVPDRLVLTGLRVGSRCPLHCTALGKVLIGCAPEKVRQAYDRRIGSDGLLERFTEATIVDPLKLFEHLRTVAVRGSSLDLEEYSEGLRCAAAPIFDASGQVVAAISVSGPAARLSQSELESVVGPRIQLECERLSRDLGYAS